MFTGEERDPYPGDEYQENEVGPLRMITQGRNHGLSWIDYISAQASGARASTRATTYARDNNIGGHGTRADTYRHFLLGFDVTQRRDPNVARFILDQYEITGLREAGGEILSGSIAEGYIYGYFDMYTLQDLWNNSVAIRAGACSENEDREDSEVFRELLSYMIEDVGDVRGRLGIQTNPSVTDSPDARRVRGRWDLSTNQIYFVGQDRTLNLYRNTLSSPRPY